MTKRSLVAFIAAIGWPASAQVTVIGNDLAESCYRAVLASDGYSRDAEAICDRALAQTTLRPSDRAATRANRGILLMRGGKLDEAERDLMSADRAMPETFDIEINLAALRLYQDRPAESKQLLDEVIARGGEHEFAKAFYNRAVALEKLGRFSEAYADYATAADLEPDWPLPRQQMDRFVLEEPA